LPGGEHGLNEVQTSIQTAQLLGFTGNSSNVYNFGIQGYNLLDVVAEDMIEAIAAQPDPQCWANLASNFDWCGYTSSNLCLESGSCKWNHVMGIAGGCYNKEYCGFPISSCSTMPMCKWNNKQGCIYSP